MVSGGQAGSFYEKSATRGIFLTVALLTVIIVVPVLIIGTGRREAGINVVSILNTPDRHSGFLI